MLYSDCTKTHSTNRPKKKKTTTNKVPKSKTKNPETNITSEDQLTNDWVLFSEHLLRFGDLPAQPEIARDPL